MTPDDPQHPTAPPALPPERAFVVQLGATADPARGKISGRLVHMTSGNAMRFEGVEQLLELLARFTGDAETPPAGRREE